MCQARRGRLPAGRRHPLRRGHRVAPRRGRRETRTASSSPGTAPRTSTRTPPRAAPNLRHLEWFHDHVRIESMLFDGVLDPNGGSAPAPPRRARATASALSAADAEPYWSAHRRGIRPPARRSTAPGLGGGAPGQPLAGERAGSDEVRSTGALCAYATGSSNYRQVPDRRGRARVPSTPSSRRSRSAASTGCRCSPAAAARAWPGSACNTAVVIDWSKYCNRLLVGGRRARTCLVEPGIVLDDLNAELADAGLDVRPEAVDPRHCTIGGMIGNNSCGPRRSAPGRSSTASSSWRCSPTTARACGSARPATRSTPRSAARAAGRREIYRRLRRAARRVPARRSATRYPDIPRRVSGYDLDALLPEKGFNVARALAGTESTLVTVLRGRAELVPVPPAQAWWSSATRTSPPPADTCREILPHRPHRPGRPRPRVSIRLARSVSVCTPRPCERLPRGRRLADGPVRRRHPPGGRRPRPADARRWRREHGATVQLFDDPAHEEQIWGIREAGLGATARVPGERGHLGGLGGLGGRRPTGSATTCAIFDALYRGSATQQASSTGTSGRGACTPASLRADDRRRRAQVPPVHERGRATWSPPTAGRFSGEHGDGQSRGELLPNMFGDRDDPARSASSKRIWDPDGQDEPRQGRRPVPAGRELRLGVDYHPREPQTHFRYPEDHGELRPRAPLRCVGVGKCRRQHGGGDVPVATGSPGRRSTRTRGRARLLFEMLARRGHHRRLALRRGPRRARPVPGLQGLQERLPGQRGHGHLQGRVPLPPLRRPAAPGRALLDGLAAAWAAARLRPRPGRSTRSPTPPAWPGSSSAPAVSTGAASIPHVRRPSRSTGGSAPPDHRPGGSRPGACCGRTPSPTTSTLRRPRRRSRCWRRPAGGSRCPPAPLCCGLTWISTGQLGDRRAGAARGPWTRWSPPAAGHPGGRAGAELRRRVPLRRPELFPGDEDVASCWASRPSPWRSCCTTRAPALATAAAPASTRWSSRTVTSTPSSARTPTPGCWHAAGVEVDVLDSGCCGLAGNFGFERGHYEVSAREPNWVCCPRCATRPGHHDPRRRLLLPYPDQVRTRASRPTSLNSSPRCCCDTAAPPPGKSPVNRSWGRSAPPGPGVAGPRPSEHRSGLSVTGRGRYPNGTGTGLARLIGAGAGRRAWFR